MDSKAYKGSITIYATLCFTVIIALILVLTESARISAINSVMNTRLVLAVNSTLAGYDRDIYKHYRIFAYNGGSNDVEEIKKKVEKEVREYLNTKSIAYQRDFNKVSIASVEVKDIKKLTDNLGEMFVQEAAQYMKYKVPANLSKEFLKVIRLINQNSKTMEIVKNKSLVETKIYDTQDLLLELTVLIDGIYCEYNMFARQDNGDLIPCESFSKMIVWGLKGKETVGINNEFVYSCMQGAYYDAKKEFDCLLEKLNWLTSNFKRNDADSDKVFEECQEIIYTIEEKAKSCLTSIDNALLIVDKLESNAKEIELELKAFNESLSNAKDELSSDVYRELKKENEELLRGPISNLSVIKEQLEDNREVIQKLSEVYNCGYVYSRDGVKKAYKYFEKLREDIDGYKVDGYYFDYSKVKREMPKKKDSSMDSLSKIIEEGLARICISNYDKLSLNRLTDTGLVSLDSVFDNSSDISKRIEDLINNPIEALGTNTSKLIEAFEEEMNIGSVLSDTGEIILEKLLLGEYICEYFTSLTNTKANKKLTHSLVYEQEYIIIGNRLDRANIRGIVKRLLGIRTIINYIAIIGNSTCRAQAHTVAAGLTGFLSIPGITYLASTLIQMIWAYEEAIVDVCAITSGRYVPLVKAGTGFKVQAATIFIFGKATINNLARGYPKTDSVADFGYDEYLKLFIILTDEGTVASRAMDLIQSNINRNYSKNINFFRMIYGFEVKVSFSFKRVFSSLELVREFVREKKEKYSLSISYEGTY